MTIDPAAGPDAPAQALTGAEAYFERRLKDPEYAATYREARIKLAKTLGTRGAADASRFCRPPVTPTRRTTPLVTTDRREGCARKSAGARRGGRIQAVSDHPAPGDT